MRQRHHRVRQDGGLLPSNTGSPAVQIPQGRCHLCAHPDAHTGAGCAGDHLRWSAAGWGWGSACGSVGGCFELELELSLVKCYFVGRRAVAYKNGFLGGGETICLGTGVGQERCILPRSAGVDCRLTSSLRPLGAWTCRCDNMLLTGQVLAGSVMVGLPIQMPMSWGHQDHGRVHIALPLSLKAALHTSGSIRSFIVPIPAGAQHDAEPCPVHRCTGSTGGGWALFPAPGFHPAQQP